MMQIFKLLEDGNWHSLDEIAKKTKVEHDELIKHLVEAFEGGLVDYDASSGKVRLGHDLMSVVLQIKAGNESQAKWERKGVGTAIIPAGKGFQFQGIHIQNQTENDVEIKFTFDMKPKEIVISEAKPL
jgi:hypothetical protein